jgi:subtilisin family serine protease
MALSSITAPRIPYFRPGRAILCVNHHPQVTADELTGWTNRFLREEAEVSSWAPRLQDAQRQSLQTLGSVKNARGETFSFLRADFVDQRADLPLQKEFFDEAHRAARAGRGLSKAQALTTAQAAQALPAASLVAAMPDWLMSGSPHMGGTGGPGAWPSAVRTPPGKDAWRIRFPQNPDLQPEGVRLGEHVDVAILDAAPSDQVRAYAYHIFKEHDVPENELLTQLLDPEGPLTVLPMPYADRTSIHYSLTDHRYRMADHGLFVAGLIHSLVPNARLRLYEVLNEFGVGSWETIAGGLAQALADRDPNRPLIINTSLVLNLPRNSHTAPEFPDEWRDPDFIDYASGAVRVIFEQLVQDPHVVIVAAAGNDRLTNNADAVNKPRPEARFPAAFADVAGVGALPKELPRDASGRYKPASYSNLADDPVNVGYMTIGGEEGTRGLLGVYLDEYPTLRTDGEVQYSRNGTGFARWAGTSFAAPIISGALAAWWDQHPTASPSAAKDALTTMARAVQDYSVDHEEVIVARQG